jgi:hypothetical protein
VLVGVVGHRSLTVEAAGVAGGVCARVFTQLARAGRRPAAVSALAEGADTLFARVALALGVPLEAVKPHGEYLDDFGSSEAQAEFLNVWTRARHRTVMPYRSRSDAAYQAAMQWVAARSDLLVAVWDGLPSTQIGGTAHTVAYARSLGRPIIHVHSKVERVGLV